MWSPLLVDGIFGYDKLRSSVTGIIVAFKTDECCGRFPGIIHVITEIRDPVKTFMTRIFVKIFYGTGKKIKVLRKKAYISGEIIIGGAVWAFRVVGPIIGILHVISLKVFAGVIIRTCIRGF